MKEGLEGSHMRVSSLINDKMFFFWMNYPFNVKPNMLKLIYLEIDQLKSMRLRLF